LNRKTLLTDLTPAAISGANGTPEVCEGLAENGEVRHRGEKRKERYFSWAQLFAINEPLKRMALNQDRRGSPLKKNS